MTSGAQRALVEPSERNVTYRQLRAPARHGAYTIGQLVALAASAVLAILAGGALVRVGAPVALALTGGVLVAGAPATAAIALEGREFSIPGLLLALVRWQRAPRYYAPGASQPNERTRRQRALAERHRRTAASNEARAR